MTRLALIGGFLGSGKTTAILRLARGHLTAGRRVGIIANDLGRGLVDTQTYLAHGLPVEEMAGACFACRLDDLISAAGRLQDGHRPDVLLAEPSGSCTDIVSRVLEPLKRVYADRFHVAPYVTLLDPQRAQQALGGTGGVGFSAKVTFLYKMQQNEADVVAINKSDTLDREQAVALKRLVARNFPKSEIVVVSARTGGGFDRLATLLDGDAPARQHPVVTSVLDGERPAPAGEALLAWLNASWHLSGDDDFDVDSVLLDLVSAIQSELRNVGAEPAHVKTTLQSGANLAIANLVSSAQPPELSRVGGTRLRDAVLTINGRVETKPATLRRCVESALSRITTRINSATTCLSMNCRAPKL